MHDVYPSVTADEIYVIGDTPNDVRCGKAIGARTIAIASGRFSFEELVRCVPWWAMEKLAEPKEFLAMIEKK